MSNNKILLIIISIILSASVSSFEIEIINKGANHNPFLNFGSPDNILNDIINDMEKNMEKSQNSFPATLTKTSKNKLPHRHKEIIEVNGPGFKSIEIREVVSPDDLNKTLKSDLGMFGSFLQPPSRNNQGENILEQVMQQFEKDILNDKKNPSENIFDNLFTPQQHNPVIFLNHRRNLKHFNIFNKPTDEMEKTLPDPIKIFPSLDEMLEGIIKSEISDQSHKDGSDILNKTHKEMPHINMSDKKGDGKESIDKLMVKLGQEAISKNKKVDKQNSYNTEIEKISHTQTGIPKKSTSHESIAAEIELNKNTQSATTIPSYLNYLPSFLTFKDPVVMRYIIYALIILFIFLIVICLVCKIIQRDSELKGDTNHSINQIEDELKGMKGKNKLY